MRLISFFLLTFCFLFAMEGNAQETNEFTFINHFDKSLNFTVTINPDVIPDVGKNFSLNTKEQIKTRVLDLQKECYIHGEEKDDSHHSVFFGLEIVNNKIKPHGYISKGIAYSWTSNTITFCTPEEYTQKHTCNS